MVEREITRIFNDPGVKWHFAKEHTKWTFNLEKAPWWCVVFDRLVKSVKRCLKKTISEARLTYEERGLVSKETVVLRRWGSDTRKFGLSTELIM